MRDGVIRRFLVAEVLLRVQFWFPVWLIFLTDRGLDLTTIVIADGAFRLTAVLAELPTGVLADRLGRRRSYATLCGATAVVFAAIATVSEPVGLFVVWICWGVLWALASGTSSAYLYELVRAQGLLEDRLRIFGAATAAGNGAILASHLVAGVLYVLHPVAPFVGTALLAVAALIVVRGLPDVAGADRRHLGAGSQLRSLRATATDPGVRLVVAAGAVVLLVGWSVRILFQPLLIDLDVAPAGVGATYFGYSAAGLLAGLLAGRWTGRRDGRILLGGLAGIVAATAVVAVAPGLGPWLGIPLLGFAYHGAWTVLEVAANDHAGDRTRATVLSAVGMLGGLLIVVARPALGIIADRWSVAAAFGVWAAVGALLLPVAAAVTRRLDRLPHRRGSVDDVVPRVGPVR